MHVTLARNTPHDPPSHAQRHRQKRRPTRAACCLFCERGPCEPGSWGVSNPAPTTLISAGIENALDCYKLSQGNLECSFFQRAFTFSRDLKMKNKLLAFWRDEEGATAIEYGLIAGLISVAILVVVGDVGDNLKLIFQSIATALAPDA